jgi:site-specific recombinase XerD
LSRKELDRHYQAFLASLKTKRPETRGTYQRALREFLRWFAADGKVRFIPRDIERYKRYLTLRKRLSPVSVSTYLTAVRRLCEFLLATGILVENPARHVGGNERPHSHTRDTLTVEEVDLLLSAVDQSDERGKRDFAMIKLMLGCGLSEIEIIRADVRDLVTSGGQTMLAVQGKGQNGKDGVVLLSDDVHGAIDRYLVGRLQLQSGEPLFASAGNRTRGARMTTRGVRDRINTCLERAGIRGAAQRRITPYSLRHTAAFLLARGGASAEEIQKRMRLGSIATAIMYIQKSTLAD